MKRLDQIHPVYGGNKVFKLKYHIKSAIEQKKKAILSFGGPFSNHLYALAGLGKSLDIHTIGVVRGFDNYINNPTMTFCKKAGMELKFLSPGEFNNSTIRNEIIEGYQFQINGKIHAVPEGGTDELGIKGAEEIIDANECDSFTHICTGMGTGGTLSGLIRSSNGKSKILGFSALKGAEYLNEDIIRYTKNYPKNWSIFHNYHFGGFAKQNSQTKAFLKEFEQQNNIEIDPVYQVKMLLGLQDLIKKDYFSSSDKVLVLHTGGLQAKQGYRFMTSYRELKN